MYIHTHTHIKKKSLRFTKNYTVLFMDKPLGRNSTNAKILGSGPLGASEEEVTEKWNNKVTKEQRKQARHSTGLTVTEMMDARDQFC